MKKNSNIIFIGLVFIVLILPILFINLKDNQISLSENRKLNEKPVLNDISKLFNGEFFTEFNSWFKDHIGFRDNIISLKGNIDHKVFNKIDVNYMYIGAGGELIYMEPEMLKSYQHKDLLSKEELSHIIYNYNVVNNYFNSLGASFVYVPCYDKHSILPEQIPSSIYQYGTVSKTDQIVAALLTDTKVNVANFKGDLLNVSTEAYGKWSDPTHWTDYGSHIAYLSIVNKINELHKVKILSDVDYNIHYEKKGYNLNGNIYKYDLYKAYDLSNPKAKKIETSILGDLASDNRHSVYYNEVIDNDLKLLIIGDSYINSYLLDDFAESFKYTYMVLGNYLIDDSLIELINSLRPDIVIIENAERVDIQPAINEFVKNINKRLNNN